MNIPAQVLSRAAPAKLQIETRGRPRTISSFEKALLKRLSGMGVDEVIAAATFRPTDTSKRSAYKNATIRARSSDSKFSEALAALGIFAFTKQNRVFFWKCPNE